jgi:SpoVK/Ycf46/Vps4 family AAA+-type ATPase
LPAPYVTPREYLDELVLYVERLLARARAKSPASEEEERARAELELDIMTREQLLAGRCEATAIAGERLPLDGLRITFGLSETEARILVVLAVLELSPEARAAAGGLMVEASASATVGLVEALVYRTMHAKAASPVELVDDGRLFVHCLAELGSVDVPWLARPIRVARRVLELALGRVRLEHEIARFATLVEECPDGDALLVETEKRAAVVDAIARQSASGFAAIPLLVGPTGSGRTSLALAGASSVRKRAIIVRAGALPRSAPELARTLGALRREALLFDAMLVIKDLDALGGDAEKGVPDLVPVAAGALASHGGPIAITASRNVWPPANRRPVVVVEFGVPAEADRAELWRRVLGDGALAAEVAARYRITGGVIERAAANARGIAGPHRAIELGDIRAGVRNQLDAELATLGRRVEWQQTWSDLVLSDDVCAELDELVARVRHRRQVLDEWGFTRKVAKGVGLTALFSGPPGTGKTMVAGLVARELGLDLYLIDVSRMVSKWIGETEKNLARLFDAASSGHVVLLFDEADSLFAKRTEVKSSNDRYANLEVNYLLQRMESFDGITILTTNLETSVDDAFKRRLAFRIKFPVPETHERAQLWRAMLPEAAAVAPGIDFRALAERFEMTGGYIRNAVLRAAYLAAIDSAPISMAHLQRAATLEYIAMGKIIDFA